MINIFCEILAWFCVTSVIIAGVIWFVYIGIVGLIKVFDMYLNAKKLREGFVEFMISKNKK